VKSVVIATIIALHDFVMDIRIEPEWKPTDLKRKSRDQRL